MWRPLEMRIARARVPQIVKAEILRDQFISARRDGDVPSLLHCRMEVPACEILRWWIGPPSRAVNTKPLENKSTCSARSFERGTRDRDDTAASRLRCADPKLAPDLACGLRDGDGASELSECQIPSLERHKLPGA